MLESFPTDTGRNDDAIPGPPLPTKAYTTLVPKFEKHPLFADFGRKKNAPFSTEIADFEAQ